MMKLKHKGNAKVRREIRLHTHRGLVLWKIKRRGGT